MSVHKPTGWNTWDFRGFNRLVYLESGRTKLTVLYAIWDEDAPPGPESQQLGRFYAAFRWDDVTRLGPHAALGLPAGLEFKAGQTPYRAEALDRDGTLELTVIPLTETRQRVVLIFVAPVGETPTVESPTSGTFAGCRVEFVGASWPRDYFLNLAEPYAVGQPGQAVTVRVRAGARAEAHGSSDAPGTLDDSERECLRGEGALADAPQAMVSAVTWNTLFDARRKLVSSPVSRDWCFDWRGVVVFCWDTFLAGTLISYESPELARQNFETVTAAVDELGMVPNYYMAHGAASLDRSMPCVGSYAIWKVAQVDPDRAWLEGLYPRLRRWHEWWMRNRDGNGNGLLSWGSNAEPDYDFPQLRPFNPTLKHSGRAAKWESGLDNSPMYDDVPFNEQTNTFELDDVGLNSYYAVDCEALAALAEFLDEPEHAARYRAEYAAMKQRVNDLLWDEQHGIYCNRHWDGRLSSRWSPTSFFPLIAGIAPPERAERMIREHLLNQREFWGEYVIPCIARSDPAYPDNDYWRGRIWGPFNFLVAEGLRRYRFDDVAAELAHKGLAMFMQNWRGDGGVYENYNAETGRGGDVWNAARLYHWGGLLALVAMQELIDVESAGVLRIGSLKFPNAGVRNVHLGGAVYDVELHEGVSACRNAAPFLECNTRAIVRIPLRGGPGEPIEVSAAGSGQLTLHGATDPSRPARINGGALVSPTGTPPEYRW